MEGREALRAEIERKHFARAALLAESLGLEEKEIMDLRLKALWQMSAIYRNGPGTKILAQQYGFSKKDLEHHLKTYREKMRKDGSERSLKSCYDHNTGRYLPFEEWMEHFYKNWDKLSVS